MQSGHFSRDFTQTWGDFRLAFGGAMASLLRRQKNSFSRFRLFIGFLVLSFASLQTIAQDRSQSQPAAFLRSNDRFAFDLLNSTVQFNQQQDHNIVLTPLPVSLTFAALWVGVPYSTNMEEIPPVLHWDKPFALDIAGRMLLARFEKPKPNPVAQTGFPQSLPPELLRYWRSGKPEESWISAAFLYRRKNSLSPDFINRVKRDFGLAFRAVDERTPQSEILAKNWDPSIPIPKITGDNDFWITSFTHLRTSWAGNTFIGANRKKENFTLQSGEVVQADFLKSEFEVYPYVKTDEFEAIVLSCWSASILLVTPAPGQEVGQLASALAKNPDLIEPLLVRRDGDVLLPPFHFTYETNLRTALEKMGIHLIFNDPRSLSSMAPARGGAVLQGVAQKTEITVDENGIRADSGTIFHGALGGVLVARDSFHMTLDHPFLFFVRDNPTGALLFVGVVMNPNLQ
jgi:serine protease inhibitor